MKITKKQDEFFFLEETETENNKDSRTQTLSHISTGCKCFLQYARMKMFEPNVSDKNI